MDRALAETAALLVLRKIGYFAICVGGLFFGHLMMSPYVVV
jgi:hypothetical protein